jgi:hypothetical protein
MRSFRILVGLSVALLAICVAVGILAIWDGAHTLYPFLKNYTPKRVMEQFESTQLPSSYGHHSGSGAGREFVTHTAGFEWHSAMRSEKWALLMNTLKDDASAQLAAKGAQILSQSDDSREGFHFEYKLGKSVGTLTIAPLVITSPLLVQRAAPLPDGTVDVTARIEQTEKWFPKGPGTIAVTINNFVG